MKTGFFSRLRVTIITAMLIALLSSCNFGGPAPEPVQLQQGAHIMLIGGNLGSRMMNYGYFETELHIRYPASSLYIRNMCDGGDTPGFRPHASRNSPWAFPGAEKFQTEYAANSHSEGHFETPDQWLTRLKADVIIGFFGYSESFHGEEWLENFKGELGAFIKHTLAQQYNGQSSPQLVIRSEEQTSELQ